MSDFSLWFAYYDSIFLNSEPKLSDQFYIDHILDDISWPTTVCPNLSKAYLLLETFLLQPDSWITSQCRTQQLLNIEAQLQHLMRFILLEKSYAVSFWEKDIRRVQASTVHLYTFLQLLVKAVIPFPTMTLFESKTTKKLCLNITNLQKMMNQILDCVNSIANFLSSQKFQQQSHIITNFFENWVYFMQKLPCIRRNKLNHVHNLIKFICLTNPIEICTVNKDIYGQPIRRKSNTVGAQILQIQSYPTAFDRIQLPKNTQNVQIQQETKIKKRKRSNSCSSSLSQAFDKLGLLQKQKLSKLFNFPPHILQYAKKQQARQKVQTLSCSVSSLRLLDKIPTLTTNQTAFSRNIVGTPKTIIKSKQKLLRSTSQKHHKTHLPKSKNISNCEKSVQLSKFYDEEVDKNQEINSVRSLKQSMVRKRQLSVISVMQNENTNVGLQNKYLNAQILHSSSSKFSLIQGKYVSSKSNKLQQNIQQYICIKTIDQILHQQ